MSAMRFTEDHEWIYLDEDGVGVVGITDYAQDQLGELVYVELPETGTEVSSGTETCVIESVKAAGEVKAPIGGRIVEVNSALIDEPGMVNEDPTGAGWFIKLEPSDPDELDGLMDEDAYREYVDGL